MTMNDQSMSYVTFTGARTGGVDYVNIGILNLLSLRSLVASKQIIPTSSVGWPIS